MLEVVFVVLWLGIMTYIVTYIGIDILINAWIINWEVKNTK